MRFPVLFAGSLAVLMAVGGCTRPGHATDADNRATGATGTTADRGAGVPEPTQATRGVDIALLYSSNLQGEYEHCGCPSHPLGGLVRRATVIDRARADADGVLIVDAGDLLLPRTPRNDALRPPEPAEILRRAHLILAAYARMGIHAFLPAERDLAVGPAQLKRLLKSLGVPAVASNLVDQQGQPLFDRDRIVTVAGIPIGIFGVVAPLPEDQAAWRTWQIRATDPAQTARDEVASLRARGARMILALLHLGPTGTATKFLAEVPGITWAVQGHAEAQLETPEIAGGARLMEAMAMGKLAGRLDVHVVDGTSAFTDRGERAQVQTILDDHRHQLADIETRAAEDKTEQLRDYYRLRRDGIGAAIARETDLLRKLPVMVRGSWYENRIIPLDAAIPDQRAIALLVNAYNAESARRATLGLPVGIAPTAAGVPTSSGAPLQTKAPAFGVTLSATSDQPTGYAGSAACADCHQPAWRIFQTTKHAHALHALAADRRDRDPTCVGCHTTGYLQPGGTRSVAVATGLLKDVGCEACHGPSREHATATASGKRAIARRKVDESVCRGCHTPDQTNGEFEYKTFLRAVLGPGHGA